MGAHDTDLLIGSVLRQTNILREKMRYCGVRRLIRCESGQQGQKDCTSDRAALGRSLACGATGGSLPVQYENGVFEYIGCMVCCVASLIRSRRRSHTCFSISRILRLLPKDVLKAVLNGIVTNKNERTFIMGRCNCQRF